MREEHIKLESLQKMDEAILDIREEMNGLVGKIKKFTSEADKVKKEHDDNIERLKQLESNKGDLDKMLFIEQERLKKFKSRLQGQSIKNQHTINANQKEIEKSKHEIESIESNILKVMQDIETLRVLLEGLKAKMGEIDKSLNDSMSESDKRNIELEESLKERKAEREKLAGEIPETTLNVYHKIQTKYPRNPVAGAYNEFCLGCHMHIPPQLYNELMRADKLITCPNCRRVLYFKEPVQEGNGQPVAGG